jgi:hypothetical protein
MGKRLAIIILVVLLAVMGVMGYLLFQSRKTLLTDPYKAVVPGSCFIIETVDLKSFINNLTSGQGLFGELSKIKELKTFSLRLKYFADQLNKPQYTQLINERTVVISVAGDKNNKLQVLFSSAVAGNFKKRHLYQALSASGAGPVSESKKGSADILAVPYSIESVKDTLYLSLISGLLLCSTSDDMIMNSDSTIASGSDIRGQNGFSRVFMASGKKEDKLFVIFRNLRPVVNSLYTESGRYISEKILRLADAGSGDIYIHEEGLILSGYTESTDNRQVLNKYKSVNSKDFLTFRILPASTVMFETSVRLSEMEAGGKVPVDELTAAVSSRMKQYLGTEVTRAYIDIRSKPASENSLVIYELSDRNLAEQSFLSAVNGTFQTTFFSPDESTRIPVYNVNISGFAGIVDKGFADNAEETFVTFYDRFMITGNSYITVSRLLYENLLNKTLENDMLYREFESTLPSRSGYFFFCVPSKITELLSAYLRPEIISTLKSNHSFISRIQAVGYQMAPSNGMIYNSISVSFMEKEREESTTEWETLLDTIAAIKPFFFTNHITGAREIFIQDLNNNTYLINSAGRVLWKVPVRERITGSVYMVDYFRNGKYQLLFSGRQFIHLLDRNGNYVERYPVKLRSPATNPLAVFDYDNNRNYRLLVAGEDRNIYAYDIQGNIVKGWKLFRTPGKVSPEIVYYRNAGKDYLIVSDETTLYFVDRSGNKRLNLKEPVSRAAGSAMRLSPGSEQSVVCTSPEGMVQHIYFDGSVKKFSLHQFNIDHSFDFFDVDGDGFGEYIFIEKGILYLYDHDKSEVFKRDFETDDAGGPICFIFSPADRKIGIFDSSRKLIYLIEKNGETAKGFPLKGASMFSIGKLSEKNYWHLIVGGTDRFLYNYKFETD